MRARGIAGALILIALAASVEAAGTSQSASPGPSVLRRFPARCSSFAFLGDPAPALRRLLVSAPVKFVLEQSGLTRLPGAKLPTARSLVDALYAQLFNVPVEVAAGASDAAMESLGAMFELNVLAQFAHGAHAEPEDKSGAEVRAEIAAVLERFRCPELCVWMRFRRERELDATFRMIDAIAERVAKYRPDAVEREAAHVAIKLDVSTLFEEGQLRGMLVDRGLVAAIDDPIAGRMAAALRRLTVKLDAARTDDGLRVQLGDWPEELPLASEALGPLWSQRPPPLAFARWNIGPFRESAARAAVLLDRWKGTAMRQHVERDDTEDWLGSMRRMVVRVQGFTARGSARFDDQPDLAGTLRFHDAHAAPPLAGSELLRFVPADVAVVDLRTDESLAEWAIVQLTDFENRLANQRIQAHAHAGGAGLVPQEQQLEQLAHDYYEKLAPFRKLVLEASPAYFEPGRALLVRAGGQESQLEVSRGGKDATHLRIDGFRAPEIAVVARLRGGAKVAQLGGDMDRSLQDPKGDNAELRATGDLALVHAVEGPYLVVATSRRLLADVLAAHAGTKPAFRLPAEAPAAAGGYGLTSGDVLVQAMKDLAAVPGHISGDGLFVKDLATWKSASTFIEALADACRAMDRHEWWTAPAGADEATAHRLILRTPR